MRNTLSSGLFLAVAERKAWNVDAAWFHRGESEQWKILVQGFHPLPRLLEETDTALSRGADLLTLHHILSRLSDIKSNTTGMFPEVISPTTLDVSTMQSLDATAEEHVVMTESAAFPDLFVPMTKDGSAEAFKVVLPSFLSLVLQCTILRIWHFRPEAAADTTTAGKEEAEQEAYTHACTLCKASLSFTQNENLADGATLRFCLTLARNVFEQQDRRAEIGWCHACLIANQLRMLRIRNNGSPTPCKVENITSGIAEAGRYKSQFDPRAFVIRGVETPSMRMLRSRPEEAETSTGEG